MGNLNHDPRHLLRALRTEGESRFEHQPLSVEIFDALIDALPDKPEEWGEHVTEGEFMGMRYPTDLTLRLFALVSEQTLATLPLEPGRAGAFGSLESGATYNTFEDVVRTKKFLLGVRETLRSFPREAKLHIMDAGCGAVPLLGLYAALVRPESTVTLLEYNPHFARIACDILEAHSLTNARLEVADATRYIPHAPIDVLLTETINQGLMGESLSDISAHVVPHLSSVARVVPKRVHISCALLEQGVLQQSPRKIRITHDWTPMITVPEFFSYVRAMRTISYNTGDAIERLAFEFPIHDLAAEDLDIAILTEVDVTEHITLTMWESFVTFPHIAGVAPLGAAKKAGASSLVVDYMSGIAFNQSGSLVHVAY